MAWQALSGDLSVRHVLDSKRLRGGSDPHYALCGVQLDPRGDADYESLSECATCRVGWEHSGIPLPRLPRRGGASRLPRCTCPICGGVHKKGRNT